MLYNQIKAGIILNYVMIGLNTLVGLLYTPYLLRMLGQSEYGLYSLVSSIIAYLTILDLGFGNAAIRYTAKLKADGKKQEQFELFGMFLWLYSIISIITVVLGAILYFNVDALFSRTMSDSELVKAKIMMLLLILNLAFTFPMSLFGSIIQAYERFVFLKLLEIGRILLTTIVMIVLLYDGYKAISLVVVQTLFNIVLLCFHYLYCIKILKIKIVFRRIDSSLLKEISKYSFWIFIMIIVDRIYWGTGQFVLGASIGTAAVAVFAVSVQMHTMYQQFSTALSSIFLPKVTAMVTKSDNKKEISDLFIKTGRIQFIILSFILVGFILFGREFIILWAGKEYELAYILSLLFIVPSIVPLCQNLGIVILQARNQMKFRSLCYLAISIISLILQIYLVKLFGSIGCAIAIAIALVVGQVVVMNIYYCYSQKLDISRFWKEFGRMTILPLCVCCGYYLLSCKIDFIPQGWTCLILSMIVFASFYIPLAYFLQMNTYERSIFVEPIKRIFKH